MQTPADSRLDARIVVSPTEAPVSTRARLSSIISALSYALDLTEGQPIGHAVQSCVLGMRIADGLTLTAEQRTDLYYALLLKDSGCSSNASRLYRVLQSDDRAAKRDVKTSDWTRVSLETLRYLKRHAKPGRPIYERMLKVLEMAANREQQTMELVQTRCERGAAIARKMGFSQETADAVYSLDEHWNGKGYPDHLRGEAIPLYSRIMNLAQSLDVYHSLRGPAAAIDMAVSRRGRWFDPELVAIVKSWGETNDVWSLLEEDRSREAADALGPERDDVEVDGELLNTICEAFADVIDAKSPFTFRHSTGVAAAATAMSDELGLDGSTRTTIRRAALLHDIGKLSVSNTILEKPGKLTDEEWKVMRLHPYYTLKILEKVPVFRDFAVVAAAHHEKLDGSGYHLGFAAEQLPLMARLLTVADIFDALNADRPYRLGMPLEKALEIIDSEGPAKLDQDCVDALKTAVHRESFAQSLAAVRAKTLAS